MRGVWIAGLAVSALTVGSDGWGAEPDLGQRVYVERCSPCHGEEGRGDGPTAPALQPPPRNLRDAAFWKDRTIEQLRGVVKGGKPGTMMPPFQGVLSDAEIDAVVQALRRFDPAQPGEGSAK